LHTFEQYTGWECEKGGRAPGAPPSESATVLCILCKVEVVQIPRM